MKTAGQRGLTLIEVLLAATILFTALAVAADSYRASVAASRKASTSVTLLAPLPGIVTAVQEALRANPDEKVQGRGELLGVSYQFDATSVAFAAPPSGFDQDSAEFVEYRPRFRLYQVQLSLKLGSATRQFGYQELAWLPLERNR
jgi:hypothetical protein